MAQKFEIDHDAQLWRVSYSYDELSVDLAEMLDWDDVMRILRGIRPGSALTEIVIKRVP